MARGAISLQHAVAVAEHFDAVMAVKAAAFGVGNTFIRLQRRLLRASSQINGFIRGYFRRVEQVEIRRLKGQQIFICHARARVRRGIASNIQRCLYGTGNRLRA